MSNSESGALIDSEGIAALHSFIRSVRALVACKSEDTLVNAQKWESVTQHCKTMREELSTALALKCTLGDATEDSSAGSLSQMSEEQLIQMRSELQHRVSRQNECMKELMDQSRHLLEALSLWDTQKKQLERLQAQSQR
ncbi:hypothetical protein CEUSTIGMA_g13504.t1 [Chlamydomonas eustigma]|uniref:Uncharacterized protein n=1 Tax=Chlamydomonas eustigma TaxID=1157962 RepID=A0A250XSM6_9CHLO|nr:hypothetical protein CEUSTIGMA_g13504.t1 [Chlamydomonas eustigma]|eukprot:GAX86091.1 hypothetical protein CEUSTIGMA_g13504.t1 [Chlamydomonas eustigma]